MEFVVATHLCHIFGEACQVLTEESESREDASSLNFNVCFKEATSRSASA